MQILDHDELSTEAENQVHLLDSTAGWGPMDFQRIAYARKKKESPAADYFGVYAVERGAVLSMVRVLRLPFSTSTGVERIAAIQGVVTRRDRSRMGLARKLMEEVHRREKEAGTRLSLLWTGRGQVAHHLYESLGYSDVYTPEIAILHCPRKAPKPKGYELRKIKGADIGLIERLHTEATKGRLGFTPRHPGLVSLLLKLRFISRDSIRLIVTGDEPIGYAFIRRSLGQPSVEELITIDKQEPWDVLSLFESEASGGWLIIRNTAVRDNLKTLQARHYSITYLSYYSLLAAELPRRNHPTPRALGTTSRLFTCQMIDYF